jgi:hypothetical protein
LKKEDEAEARSRRLGVSSILLIVILAVSVVLSAYALVTVSRVSQLPPADFVSLPTTPLSKSGESVALVNVGPISQTGGVTVGVTGYLKTASGAPVPGAMVYMTYYLQGAYRTQVATTDQNGSFQAYFPMNWTGWLPLTFTYFGDGLHQGLTTLLNLQGESG